MPTLTFGSADELKSISHDIAPFFNLQLGDILVAQGDLTQDQLIAALKQQEQQPEKRLGRILLSLGFITEAKIHQALMKKFGIPTVQLREFTLPEEVKYLIPYDIAVEYSIFPLCIVHKRLFLAMADPLDWRVVNHISALTTLSVEPVLALSSDIQRIITQYHDCSTEQTSFNRYQDDTQIVPSRTHIAEAETRVVGLRDQWTPASTMPTASDPHHRVINQRFELLNVLGQGGMGTVYKALDRRRKEANDRYCYVALKVLNEDFQKHPGAFVTLQREASKTQLLSHPNIVKVNDFDRDGDTVFIVMEYLQGRSLSDILCKDYPEGMPLEQTCQIIQKLANALDFAHTHHIIHCDFKPGNAFITDDGTVKVIDFGISRASGAAQKQVNFCDLSVVSGCTPSYATTELFYGEEPLPSDDVYALACAMYRMLTGTHPFQRHSAVEAQRLGLQAKRIPCLSTQQWRALQKGLSFSRQQRTPTVHQFIQDLEPWRIPKAMLALSLLSLALMYFLILPYWHARQVNDLIETLNHSPKTPVESVLIETVLEQTQTLSDANQRTFFNNHQVRERLMQYYQTTMAQLINLPQQTFEFAQAQQLLATGRQQYPDSMAFFKLEQQMMRDKLTVVARLSSQYQYLMADNALLATPKNLGLPTVLKTLYQIDPTHWIFTEDECRQRYVQAIQAGLNAGDKTRAQRLFQVALLFWANHPDLSAFGW